MEEAQRRGLGSELYNEMSDVCDIVLCCFVRGWNTKTKHMNKEVWNKGEQMVCWLDLYPKLTYIYIDTVSITFLYISKSKTQKNVYKKLV